MKNYKNLFKNIKLVVLDVDGVLTNGNIMITEKGDIYRTYNVKDGLAIVRAKKQNIEIAVISGAKSIGIRKRMEPLGVKYIYLGSDDKLNRLKEVLALTGIDPKHTGYMGDDLPDLPAMKYVALPCCPKDADIKIKKICKFISSKNGGEGAVRELIDRIIVT